MAFGAFRPPQWYHRGLGIAWEVEVTETGTENCPNSCYTIDASTGQFRKCKWRSIATALADRTAVGQCAIAPKQRRTDAREGLFNVAMRRRLVTCDLTARLLDTAISKEGEPRAAACLNPPSHVNVIVGVKKVLD